TPLRHWLPAPPHRWRRSAPGCAPRIGSYVSERTGATCRDARTAVSPGWASVPVDPPPGGCRRDRTRAESAGNTVSNNWLTGCSVASAHSPFAAALPPRSATGGFPLCPVAVGADVLDGATAGPARTLCHWDRPWRRKYRTFPGIALRWCGAPETAPGART